MRQAPVFTFFPEADTGAPVGDTASVRFFGRSGMRPTKWRVTADVTTDGTVRRLRQDEREENVGRAAAASMKVLAQEFSDARDMLVALGNENRQAIFIALLENPGGVRVGNLAELASLSRPATSHHLKILKDAGFVERFTVGTKSYYHASARLDHWTQLARLTAHAEAFVRRIADLEAEGFSPCPSTHRIDCKEKNA